MGISLEVIQFSDIESGCESPKSIDNHTHISSSNNISEDPSIDLDEEEEIVMIATFNNTLQLF